MSVLAEIESTLQSILERSGPAVVGLGRGWGTGSGVVIAPDLVLVSAHGLREDTIDVAFADGSRREGTVGGADRDLDLAVIRVQTGGVEPLEWSAQSPKAGQAVIALANPGGRGVRVSFGFISAVDRSFRGPRGRRVAGALEHSAPLPRGSAGSPLLDTAGGLLGVNAVRADGGLILATPADQGLRQRVDALARGEAPRRVRLGVALATPRSARELRRAVGLPEREGLLVRAVLDDGAAAAAGVRRGDLIVRLGEHATPRLDDLHEALDAAGETSAELVVVRGSDEHTLALALGGGR